MTGLLESGAVKEVPLWYDVYKIYPPEQEAFVDRAIPPQDPVPELVYKEDFEKVKKSRVTIKEEETEEIVHSSRFKRDPLDHIARVLGEK